MDLKRIEEDIKSSKRKFAKILPKYKEVQLREPNLREYPEKPDIPEKSKQLKWILRLLSSFSFFLSISIISVIISIGLLPYLVFFFSIVTVIFLLGVEYNKVNNIILWASGVKTLETISISILTLMTSIILSTYGGYNLLDQIEKTKIKLNKDVNLIVSDTTNYFQSKIDSINSLPISNVEPFASDETLLLEQLKKLKEDRDNYQGADMRWNNNLRNFYKATNDSISSFTEKLSKLRNEFYSFRDNKVKDIENKQNRVLKELNKKNNEKITKFSNKNTNLIFVFIIVIVILELSIVYTGYKTGLIQKKINEILDEYMVKYNKIKKQNEEEKERVDELNRKEKIEVDEYNRLEKKRVSEYNEKIEEEKITYITSKPEWKKYIMYKTIITKIFSSKVKGDKITAVIFGNYLPDVTTKEKKTIYSEFISMDIFSETRPKVGSKVLVEEAEAFNILTKYFQPYFDDE